MNKKLNALYHQIGGEARLRLILRDFYHRMAEDLLIGYFFQGKDPNVIADQQLLFLMYAMGILPSYSGKSPTSAHLELPTIHTGHFDRRLVLLRETLQSHQVQARDIETWIDFEEAFRGVVVSI